MSDLFFNKRKNIFDILNEAEDDDQGGNDQGTQDTQTADATTNDQNQDNADDTANDQGGDDEEMGSDEDFDVDTTMDDEGGDEDAGTDDGTDDSSMDDSSGGSSFGDDSEAEVNPTNTNIFSSLTKEEQSIKIKELKRLYNDLYIYICDMYTKMNDIYPDENNIDSIYRVTTALYDLKKNISDYISSVFDTKSYIENDIAYNRYLTIVQSIKNIIETLYTEIAQKQDKK